MSIKLAEKVEQPMSKAPLVIHPADARRVQPMLGSGSGVVFDPEPYKGSSTQYDGGVLGRALSLAGPAAIEAFVAAATEAVVLSAAEDAKMQESQGRSTEIDDSVPDDVDSVLVAAAAAEVDADLASQHVDATTRQRLIEARLGQGQYREDLIRIWGARCAVTGCGVVRALVASHAVPWKDDKDPAVRLDPYNGLLLAASIDRLFDRGLIGFANDGRLLLKPEVSPEDLPHLGLRIDVRLRQVDPRHLPYLAAHRARHGF